MKRIICAIIISLLPAITANGQKRIVQNRPYTDLRQFHFGILLGTHLQDIEFTNIGLQTINNEDGTSRETHITTDQNRWDYGFQVGVAGETRLTENLQLRLAPTMYFGSRHFMFQEINRESPANEEYHQDLKTVYIATAAELIFDGPRLNNMRPYVMGGIEPMLNLNNKNQDYLKLKKYDIFAEVGMGIDLYLPYFKLRPELKFMFSLINSLDKKHAQNLKDKSMLPYTNSVKEARSKIIALTFYFE
ncbi:PorT family protein [Prevotella sp. A2931]|uniref:PorT family protein n=1 Tax=Prevotella illustrans TaxID=2800387 RepID=A0ABS3M5C2_9BACT|nr:MULTISPECIES: porin family protein [Prevotella]MBO1363378.1 PorT family protein [Prevotella illustrans]PTL26134.1 PorT family protein [Prevotella sp. oral taxon 820]